MIPGKGKERRRQSLLELEFEENSLRKGNIGLGLRLTKEVADGGGRRVSVLCFPANTGATFPELPMTKLGIASTKLGTESVGAGLANNWPQEVAFGGSTTFLESVDPEIACISMSESPVRSKIEDEDDIGAEGSSFVFIFFANSCL
jgi:hypothetical protein